MSAGRVLLWRPGATILSRRRSVVEPYARTPSSYPTHERYRNIAMRQGMHTHASPLAHPEEEAERGRYLNIATSVRRLSGRGASAHPDANMRRSLTSGGTRTMKKRSTSMSAGRVGTEAHAGKLFHRDSWTCREHTRAPQAHTRKRTHAIARKHTHARSRACARVRAQTNI